MYSVLYCVLSREGRRVSQYALTVLVYSVLYCVLSREGKRVSQYALPVLVACLIMTGLGAAGLPFLHSENNMIKLWIPQVR